MMLVAAAKVEDAVKVTDDAAIQKKKKNLVGKKKD
jgi:hypothetical protein